MVDTENKDGAVSETKMQERLAVYKDLLAHRDAVCVAFTRLISVTEGYVSTIFTGKK